MENEMAVIGGPAAVFLRIFLSGKLGDSLFFIPELYLLMAASVLQILKSCRQNTPYCRPKSVAATTDRNMHAVSPERRGLGDGLKKGMYVHTSIDPQFG